MSANFLVTVGQKTSAGSIPVVIASDQPPIPVADVGPVLPNALGTFPVRRASEVVKNAPGTLWTIYANNSSNADIWLLTFDAVAVPANGTRPIDFVQIPRKNNGEQGIMIPRDYAVGIVWAASTTVDTLTLAGAVLLTRPRFT